MLNQIERDELEKLVDSYNVGDVVEALAAVCSEKGDHLRSNWNDPPSAKLWERRALALGKLAASPLFETQSIDKSRNRLRKRAHRGPDE